MPDRSMKHTIPSKMPATSLTLAYNKVQCYDHPEWDGATMTKDNAVNVDDDKEPSQLIDARIRELADWRGETLAKVRTIIRQADPEIIEEWKWRGVPVWSHTGIICTGETYKSVVKLTFTKGASLADPSALFNSSLEGNVRRAIDIHEGEAINEDALQVLVRAAIVLNKAKPPRR